MRKTYRDRYSGRAEPFLRSSGGGGHFIVNVSHLKDNFTFYMQFTQQKNTFSLSYVCCIPAKKTLIADQNKTFVENEVDTGTNIGIVWSSYIFISFTFYKFVFKTSVFYKFTFHMFIFDTVQNL